MLLGLGSTCCCSNMRAAHSRAKFSKDTLWKVRHVMWQCPSGAPAREFFFRDFSIQRSISAVDHDHVPVFQQRQVPAIIRLGCHVTNHDAPTCPGKSAVGDEWHVSAKLRANQSGAGRQHLGHAWASFGAFVADDHDIA